MKALVHPGNGIAQDRLRLRDGLSNTLHFLLDRAVYLGKAAPDIWRRFRRGLLCWHGCECRRVIRYQRIKGPRQVVILYKYRVCLTPQASQGDTPRQSGEDEKHEGDLGARQGTLHE